MMLVGHMFSAITGGIAGLICSAGAGHPILVCCVCYGLGGIVGMAAFSIWASMRHADGSLPDPER